MAIFVPILGADPDWPQAFELGSPELFIGRLPECAIRSTDGSVSRQHARLVFHEDRWWVEDLDSRNGVVVNGKAVQACTLAEGDIVRIGDQYFVYSDGDASDPAALESWKHFHVERAQALHDAVPVPTHIATPETAPPPAAVQPQAPIPPASFQPAAASVSSSPATRAYPARAPLSPAKVSAILRLPGTGAPAAPGLRPGAPTVALPPSAAPSAPAHPLPSNLNVTGPDYMWYAVIGLAVVLMIAAALVFFSRRGADKEAAPASAVPSGLVHRVV